MGPPLGSTAPRPLLGSTPMGPPLGSTAPRPPLGSTPMGPPLGSTAPRPLLGSTVPRPPLGSTLGSTAPQPPLGSTAMGPPLRSAPIGPFLGSTAPRPPLGSTPMGPPLGSAAPGPPSWSICDPSVAPLSPPSPFRASLTWRRFSSSIPFSVNPCTHRPPPPHRTAQHRSPFQRGEPRPGTRHRGGTSTAKALSESCRRRAARRAAVGSGAVSSTAEPRMV